MLEQRARSLRALESAEAPSVQHRLIAMLPTAYHIIHPIPYLLEWYIFALSVTNRFNHITDS